MVLSIISFMILSYKLKPTLVVQEKDAGDKETQEPLTTQPESKEQEASRPLHTTPAQRTPKSPRAHIHMPLKHRIDLGDVEGSLTASQMSLTAI